jgi:hypothetical protein
MKTQPMKAARFMPKEGHAWRHGYLPPSVQTKNRQEVKWIPKQTASDAGTDDRKETKDK